MRIGYLVGCVFIREFLSGKREAWMVQKQNAQRKKPHPTGRGNMDVTFLVLVLLLLTFGLIMLDVYKRQAGRHHG